MLSALMRWSIWAAQLPSRSCLLGVTTGRTQSEHRAYRVRFTPHERTLSRHAGSAASCRFCCKSLFALAIKISFGCTGDFHVNMWGTSSSEEKLAGDPGNVIEATSIGGRRSDFFTAGKLTPGNFGLLQQYLP